MSQIASYLGVAQGLVQGVVFGPAAVLFNMDYVERVSFSRPTFKAFLLDANRAGEYFIGHKLDALFTQALSRKPSSTPSPTYSREVMIGVIGVLQERGKPLSIDDIASALDVSRAAVKAFVNGPARLLFMAWGWDEDRISLSKEALDFLRDSNRSGVLSIPPKALISNDRSQRGEILDTPP